MGTAIPSIDGTLNLIWVLVSLAIVLCWRAEWTRESRRSLVAILCVLVLLFPAISVADDLAQRALLYDLSSSSLTVNGDNECKQLVMPALLSGQSAQLFSQPWRDAIGETVGSDGVPYQVVLLLDSASGIHSPPTF